MKFFKSALSVIHILLFVASWSVFYFVYLLYFKSAPTLDDVEKYRDRIIACEAEDASKEASRYEKFLKGVGASESDLVFGLVAEEMGVIVAITLAIAVACLVIYARAITTRSRSTFYSISACCAAGLLVVQLSLNVFGATDILPLTGVTFPFISCGGSSVLSCWGLVAFIKAADERTYAVKK